MNFFIGQPLRVVGAPDVRERFRGAEVRFHCHGLKPGLRHDHRDNCCVSINGDIWGAHTDYLEPILPSGAQPSEFTTLHDLLNSLEGVCV